MPSHLKKAVRARMRKTGESYQQAQRHIRVQVTTSLPRPAEDRVVGPLHVVREAGSALVLVRRVQRVALISLRGRP